VGAVRLKTAPIPDRARYPSWARTSTSLARTRGVLPTIALNSRGRAGRPFALVTRDRGDRRRTRHRIRPRAGIADRVFATAQTNTARANADCCSHETPGRLEYLYRALQTSAPGQPQPRERGTPAWLLSPADGNAEPAAGRGWEGRRCACMHLYQSDVESGRRRRRPLACAPVRQQQRAARIERVKSWLFASERVRSSPNCAHRYSLSPGTAPGTGHRCSRVWYRQQTDGEPRCRRRGCCPGIRSSGTAAVSRRQLTFAPPALFTQTEAEATRTGS
jgi:hypothetical protein